jgi:hypothetical protein
MRKSSARETVARYRARAARRGLLRLELQVPREDAELIRAVAALLRDGPAAESERAREELKTLARTASGTRALKDLLAAAPLEGVEIRRSRDTGRFIELP